MALAGVKWGVADRSRTISENRSDEKTKKKEGRSASMRADFLCQPICGHEELMREVHSLKSKGGTSEVTVMT